LSWNHQYWSNWINDGLCDDWTDEIEDEMSDLVIGNISMVLSGRTLIDRTFDMSDGFQFDEILDESESLGILDEEDRGGGTFDKIEGLQISRRVSIILCGVDVVRSDGNLKSGILDDVGNVSLLSFDDEIIDDLSLGENNENIKRGWLWIRCLSGSSSTMSDSNSLRIWRALLGDGWILDWIFRDDWTLVDKNDGPCTPSLDAIQRIRDKDDDGDSRWSTHNEDGRILDNDDGSSPSLDGSSPSLDGMASVSKVLSNKTLDESVGILHGSGNTLLSSLGVPYRFFWDRTHDENERSCVERSCTMDDGFDDEICDDENGLRTDDAGTLCIKALIGSAPDTILI
jgi:hypothetical protein